MYTMPSVSAMRLTRFTAETGSLGAGAQGDQGVAVGLASRHLVRLVVAGQLDRRLPRTGDRAPEPLREGSVGPQVTLASELGDGPLRHVLGQGLAVPPLLVLELGEALALDRAS